MVNFPFHGHRERVCSLGVSFLDRFFDHARVKRAELLGFFRGNRPQVFQAGANIAGNSQVVDAVNRLGSGDFLKNLGDFRQTLFHRLDGVGVVFQVGHRFGNNGSPKVLVGVAHLGCFRGHNGILGIKRIG